MSIPRDQLKRLNSVIRNIEMIQQELNLPETDPIDCCLERARFELRDAYAEASRPAHGSGRTGSAAHQHRVAPESCVYRSWGVSSQAKGDTILILHTGEDATQSR